MDADYCLCQKGQRIREAHLTGKDKPKQKRKEWLPYREREPGEEG
jgi:hypothetical protein